MNRSEGNDFRKGRSSVTGKTGKQMDWEHEGFNQTTSSIVTGRSSDGHEGMKEQGLRGCA